MIIRCGFGSGLMCVPFMKTKRCVKFKLHKTQHEPQTRIREKKCPGFEIWHLATLHPQFFFCICRCCCVFEEFPLLPYVVHVFYAWWLWWMKFLLNSAWFLFLQLNRSPLRFFHWSILIPVVVLGSLEVCKRLSWTIFNCWHCATRGNNTSGQPAPDILQYSILKIFGCNIAI